MTQRKKTATINEINRESNFYQTIMKERVLVA